MQIIELNEKCQSAECSPKRYLDPVKMSQIVCVAQFMLLESRNWISRIG